MEAKDILIKACEYDAAERRLEALKLYEDGIRLLFETCRSMHLKFIFLQLLIKII